MIKNFLAALTVAFTPAVLSAEVQQLPISADYCAIKRAMTGVSDPNCPVVDAPGLPRGYAQEAVAPEDAGQSNGYYIHFAFGSDDLTLDYQAHLSRLSDVLSSDEMSNLCLKLVGHTDTVGSANFNMTLSERRAKTVRLYLVGALRFSENRILTEGQGESQILPEMDGQDARNRRVEILAREPVDGNCLG